MTLKLEGSKLTVYGRKDISFKSVLKNIYALGKAKYEREVDLMFDVERDSLSSSSWHMISWRDQKMLPNVYRIS